MIISVVNHAHEVLKDEQVIVTLRAINRQIAEDFAPYWGKGAQLRLEPRKERAPHAASLAELRGEAILHLCTDLKDASALGYHDEDHHGIPYGFVLTTLCEELGECWTTTLSHEALELLGDVEANLLVAGPHPEHPEREVFHWYEACDAVQGESYSLDGVEVSNFVLPAYFTRRKHGAARCDFLGRSHQGKRLKPFGVNPGGYVGFFDPKKHAHVTYPADTEGERRLERKSKLGAMGRTVKRRELAG